MMQAFAISNCKYGSVIRLSDVGTTHLSMRTQNAQCTCKAKWCRSLHFITSSEMLASTTLAWPQRKLSGGFYGAYMMAAYAVQLHRLLLLAIVDMDKGSHTLECPTQLLGSMLRDTPATNARPGAWECWLGIISNQSAIWSPSVL